MSNLALSNPFDDMGEMDAKIVSALEGSITALQAARLHQAQIRQLQANKADARELRALRFEVGEVISDVHQIKASRELITARRFSDLCRFQLDDEGIKNLGASLSKWSRVIGLPAEKVVYHDGLNKNINGYHPYVLKLYCLENDIPVPTQLLVAQPPSNWQKPRGYLLPEGA